MLEKIPLSTKGHYCSSRCDQCLPWGAGLHCLETEAASQYLSFRMVDAFVSFKNLQMLIDDVSHALQLDGRKLYSSHHVSIKRSFLWTFATLSGPVTSSLRETLGL